MDTKYLTTFDSTKGGVLPFPAWDTKIFKDVRGDFWSSGKNLGETSKSNSSSHTTYKLNSLTTFSWTLLEMFLDPLLRLRACHSHGTPFRWSCGGRHFAWPMVKLDESQV